jgi:hypothetical protein
MELVQNVIISNLLNDREVRITWDALTGATSYKIYRSAIPYDNFTLLASTAALTYTDTPNLIPINEWYYYVVGYDGASEGPAPSVGVTFIDYSIFDTDPFTETTYQYPENSEMEFYFEEIRRRDLWMLQNDGEDMTLMKRRYEGTKCPLIESEYDQCPYPLGYPIGTSVCYGTGYLGGYYDPLTLKVRRIDADKKITTDISGLRIEMPPRLWTIWTPRIATGDFFVDSSNRRWEVKSVHPYLWRGLILHQDFEVDLKGTNEMLYRIPIT